MLLTREISIPSRKVLRSPSLHRVASTDFLIPGRTGSKRDFWSRAREGADTPCSATPKGTVSDP